MMSKNVLGLLKIKFSTQGWLLTFPIQVEGNFFIGDHHVPFILSNVLQYKLKTNKPDLDNISVIQNL